MHDTVSLCYLSIYAGHCGLVVVTHAYMHNNIIIWKVELELKKELKYSQANAAYCSCLRYTWFDFWIMHGYTHSYTYFLIFIGTVELESQCVIDEQYERKYFIRCALNSSYSEDQI